MCVGAIVIRFWNHNGNCRHSSVSKSNVIHIEMMEQQNERRLKVRI